MINAMKVGEHRKKWAKKLSGGTKRKVSCNTRTSTVMLLYVPFYAVETGRIINNQCGFTFIPVSA